jgi:hypothetical protein
MSPPCPYHHKSGLGEMKDQTAFISHLLITPKYSDFLILSISPFTYNSMKALTNAYLTGSEQTASI